MKRRVRVDRIIGIVIVSIALIGFTYVVANKILTPVKEATVEKEPIGEEDKIETIIMMATGDIMYHGHQIVPVATQPSGYDYYDNLALTKPYFKNADISIANYETTTTTSRRYASYPQFNTPVESLDALKDAGIDILSTINNHTLDSGRQGLIDTHDEILKRNMIPLGTRTKVEPSLKNIQRKGIKLGFLAYTYGFNGLDSMLTSQEHEYMVSQINEEKMEQEIKESKSFGNDLTVVMIHWGNEYQSKPSQQQRDLANKLVEWGVDIILGSHPHVVQEHEIIDDSFVIYSMGNFLSDQRLESLNNIDTERGLMVEFTIEKNFTTNKTKIKEIDYHPVWVNKYFTENRYYYETIPAKDFLDKKINPYVPEGSFARIQSAYDETMKRVNGLD